jgi:hypothetical protein
MSSRELVTGNLDYLRAESLRPVLLCIGAVLYVWGLILFQPANLFPVDHVKAAAWGPVPLGVGVALAFVLQKLFYALYLYLRAFEIHEMGYGSAMAWVLLGVIAIFTVVVFRSSSTWVYYESGGVEG